MGPRRSVSGESHRGLVGNTAQTTSISGRKNKSTRPSQILLALVHQLCQDTGVSSELAESDQPVTTTTDTGLVQTHGNVRIFRGDTTRQIDHTGAKADPELWYYEPADYDGDALWSTGHGSYAEAYNAAGCSQE